MIGEDTDFISYSRKEETSTTNDDCANNTCARGVSTTTTRLKDPRIVRVSRAFGGKDRHSKVCTVRGLRDRRVRLSVPTAIQLYDLQDRLGLNQPSKVVDWLLNEAKEAIDELPPLQIPQGMSSLINNSQGLPHPMFTTSSQHRGEFLSPHSDKSLKIDSSGAGINWGNDKHVSGEASSQQIHFLDQNNDHCAFASSSTSNDSSRQTVIPFPTLFNGSLPCNNPSIRWDPRSHDQSSTSDNNNNDGCHPQSFGLVQLPPHIPEGSHSVLVYRQKPDGVSTSYFNAGPSQQTSAAGTDFESKQADYHGLQLSNSSFASPGNTTTQPSIRPFQFHMTANLLPQNTDVDEQNDSNQFHSS